MALFSKTPPSITPMMAATISPSTLIWEFLPMVTLRTTLPSAVQAKRATPPKDTDCPAMEPVVSGALVMSRWSISL